MDKTTVFSMSSKTEYVFKKKSQTSISGANLVGTELLRVKFTTTTFKARYAKYNVKGKTCMSLVSKEPVGEVSKYQDFKLVEVSREELLEIRKSKVAGFVLKLGDKLYYTELTPNISLFSVEICGDHQCCCGQKMCKHLSAASDENGGCAKVRGYSYGIERYDFITKGCETFGTRHDMFVVASCVNYEECPPRKEIPFEKRREMRLELARFIWEDVETLEQVQQRKRKNHERNAREAAIRVANARRANKANKTGKDNQVAKTT